MVMTYPDPMIIWRSSRSCGMNCSHCFAPKTGAPELDIERKRSLLREIGSMSRRFFSIEGDDPHISILLEDLAALEIPVSLAISGTAYHEDLVRDHASGIHYLHLSLDGHDAKTHDRLRGSRGDFDRVMALIDSLGDVTRIFVTCAAGAWNHDSVLPLARLLSSRKVSVFCVNVVTPFGNASGHDVSVAPDTWLAIEKKLTRIARPDGMTILFEPGWSTLDELEDFPSCASHDRRLCMIDADGSVHFCPLMMSVDGGRHRLGSLMEDSLPEIWGNSDRWGRAKALANSSVAPFCHSCSSLEACRGGCPAFRLMRQDDPAPCLERGEYLPVCCMHRRRVKPNG